MQRSGKQLRLGLGQILALALIWGGLGSLPVVTGTANPPDDELRSVNKRAVFGKLATLGDKVVSVNGNGVRSGATIHSGSQIETPAETSASLQLWPLGRVELAPDTSLQVVYGDNQLKVNLQRGCAVLTTYSGIQGTLALPQGIVKHTGPNANEFVDVCAGGPGEAPLIDEGAAARAGAGTCWAGVANSAAVPAAAGFNPLYLLGATPLAVVGITANGNNDGRPAVASAAGL